jgi:hypothetical protein
MELYKKHMSSADCLHNGLSFDGIDYLKYKCHDINNKIENNIGKLWQKNKYDS